MSNRLFEIGDLLKIKFHTQNQELWVNAISKNSNGGCAAVCADNSRLFFTNDDILTIRKPHKGSKEARDIVAMLARRYRSEKHYFDSEIGFLRGIYTAYDLAKLMLK